MYDFMNRGMGIRDLIDFFSNKTSSKESLASNKTDEISFNNDKRRKSISWKSKDKSLSDSWELLECYDLGREMDVTNHDINKNSVKNAFHKMHASVQTKSKAKYYCDKRHSRSFTITSSDSKFQSLKKLKKISKSTSNIKDLTYKFHIEEDGIVDSDTGSCNSIFYAPVDWAIDELNTVKEYDSSSDTASTGEGSPIIQKKRAETLPLPEHLPEEETSHHLKPKHKSLSECECPLAVSIGEGPSSTLQKKRAETLPLQDGPGHHKRSCSESVKRYSLSYLTDREVKTINKIYHDRRSSCISIDPSDEVNCKKVEQRFMTSSLSSYKVEDIEEESTKRKESISGNRIIDVVMESLRIRKVKQKIATRMVRVSALNKSRPRTDKGQPFLKRDRSLTTTPSTDPRSSRIYRTTSDPEVRHSRCEGHVEGEEELLQNDQLSEETFEPLQKGDSVEETSQLPVKSLISDFNRHSSSEHNCNNLDRNNRPSIGKIKGQCITIEVSSPVEKPVPLPRPKNISQHSVDKPVPVPRPVHRCRSLEDLTSISGQKDNVVQSFDQKLFQKPTPKPKPQKLNRQKKVEDNNSEQNNKSLPDEPVIKENKTSDTTKTFENLKEESIYQNMENNNEPNFNRVAPYEVVDLSFDKNSSVKKGNYNISLIPTTPVSSNAKSMKSVSSTPNSPGYADMSDDLYLEPVAPQSPQSPCPKSPIDFRNPIEKFVRSSSRVNSQSGRSSPRAKSPSCAKSRKVKPPKITRFKKGKSVTYIQSQSHAVDIPRRKSAPHIIHSSRQKSDESHSNHASVDSQGTISDEDGWGSEEFDESEDSSDENEYEKIDSIIPKLPDLDPVSRKVYNIVTEILTTERAYVRRLYLLDEIFQKRLQQEEKENNVVPEKTISEIFSNLNSIYQFHSTFLLPELERRVFEWMEKRKIGDIFKGLGNFLKLYTEFVRNFDHATSTITHHMKKSPKFAAVVSEIQKQPECENLSLQHHMLEPIQRVPRYKLLLQDYLKRLPTEAPDRKEAEDALEIISKIAQEANNSMKENEKFKKLLDIEDRIQDGLKGESLVTASRVFLKEGELTKLAARKESTTMTRTMLLFTDILLCCAATTTKKLRVRQIMDVEGLEIDNDDTLPPLAFRIKTRQRVLDLVARDEDEKEDWISAIKAAVDDLHDRRGNLIKEALAKDEQKMGLDKPGKQAPVWVKDEDVTMCMLCAVKFGLVHRKHHCRGCGRVTCDRCSNYKGFLEYANSHCRICFACSKKLGLDVGEMEEHEFKQSAKARDSTVLTDITNNLYWKPPGKGWSKEWIALSQFVLFIQKKRQDVKAHSTVPVPGFEVSDPVSHEEIDISHPHCIKLHKMDKKEHTYYISSDNKDLIDLWRNHLECAVKLETYSVGD